MIRPQLELVDIMARAIIPGHGAIIPGHGATIPGHGATIPGHGATIPGYGAGRLSQVVLDLSTPKSYETALQHLEYEMGEEYVKRVLDRELANFYITRTTKHAPPVPPQDTKEDIKSSQPSQNAPTSNKTVPWNKILSGVLSEDSVWMQHADDCARIGQTVEFVQVKGQTAPENDGGGN